MVKYVITKKDDYKYINSDGTLKYDLIASEMVDQIEYFYDMNKKDPFDIILAYNKVLSFNSEYDFGALYFNVFEKTSIYEFKNDIDGQILDFKMYNIYMSRLLGW